MPSAARRAMVNAQAASRLLGLGGVLNPAGVGEDLLAPPGAVFAGVCSARALAADAAEVLLLERHRPTQHAFGQSHRSHL